MRDTIKDFYGRILGYIEDDGSNRKVAKNFYGKILGYYYIREDVTKDFYGRIVAQGNILSALIRENNNSIN